MQRVVMPETEFESWTVLGEDQLPIEPVERFLAYLASIERSPNTIKAYAHDLKDWFVYLAGHGRDWRSVTLEDVAGFVAWLRLPPAARDGAGGGVADGGASLFGRQREPQAGGVDVVLRVPRPPRRAVDGAAGQRWHPARRGAALGNGVQAVPASRDQERTRSGDARSRSPAPTPRPQVLTAEQVQAILDACEHLRDRLLFALLLDTGVRIGEALGLRHEDLDDRRAARSRCVPRPNDNRARAKTGVSPDGPGQRGADAAVCRLPQRRVRRAGLGLRVRQPVVGAAGAPVGLSRRLRPGAAAAACAPASTSGPTISGTRTRPGCCGAAPGWRA